VGGKSRELIKIDLPENTKGCYYSFTTAPGVDGTQLLNLGIQLGATLYGGFLGSSIASKIKVPPGAEAIDIYALTSDNATLFMNKDDNYQFFRDISIQNAKDAVQYIDNSKYGNSFYLGIRNPAAINGITLKIEVVAIVDDIKIDTNKGISYGNLGWKAYEKKDYKKSLYYSKKALTYDPNLSYVQFNIALVYLVQGKKETIDSYVDAIASCKKDKDPIGILKGALEDIRNVKAKKPNMKNLSDIEELLVNEIGEE